MTKATDHLSLRTCFLVSLLFPQSIRSTERKPAYGVERALCAFHNHSYYIVDGPNLLTLVQRHHIPYETFELIKSEQKNFRISLVVLDLPDGACCDI